MRVTLKEVGRCLVVFAVLDQLQGLVDPLAG